MLLIEQLIWLIKLVNFPRSVNDMPLGRNVRRYLRMIDAYTHIQVKESLSCKWEAEKQWVPID
jgi:peroxiredoxin (alkyl hydroperoxide reductase subunit C)